MINQVIEEILGVEKQADQIIVSAREKASQILSENALEIDKLYQEAQIQLKADVKSVIFQAETKAEEAAKVDKKAAQQRTQLFIDKANKKFDGALDKVLSTLKGE